MKGKNRLVVWGVRIACVLGLAFLVGCASHRRYSYNPTTGMIVVDIRGTDAQVGMIDFEMDPSTGGARIHIENMSQSDRMIEANQVWAETTGKLVDKLSIP